MTEVVKGKGYKEAQCFRCKRKIVTRAKRVKVAYTNIGTRYLCCHCGKDNIRKWIDINNSRIRDYRKQLRKITDKDLALEAI
jgi:hypothetical protein